MPTLRYFLIDMADGESMIVDEAGGFTVFLGLFPYEDYPLEKPTQVPLDLVDEKDPLYVYTGILSPRRVA